MDPEDYPSDSDASDEDFRPEKDDGDSVSEEDSDDNVEGHDAEDNEEPGGGKKRKQKTNKMGKKKAKLETAANTDDKEEKVLDDEDEERLTDALWADFLAGSGSSNGSASTSSNTPVVRNEPPKVPITSGPRKTSETVKTTTITKVFEFAGEAVEVTEEIPESKIESSVTMQKKTPNGTGGPSKPFPGRSSGGGLGAVLSQIGKKNKLSTLEKTKLDWNSFKRNQGIEEELQTHNKGKDGYLERQDFLQRADVRQFEIEKAFRQTSRSNR